MVCQFYTRWLESGTSLSLIPGCLAVVIIWIVFNTYKDVQMVCRDSTWRHLDFPHWFFGLWNPSLFSLVFLCAWWSNHVSSQCNLWSLRAVARVLLEFLACHKSRVTFKMLNCWIKDFGFSFLIKSWPKWVYCSYGWVQFAWGPLLKSFSEIDEAGNDVLLRYTLCLLC